MKVQYFEVLVQLFVNVRLKFTGVTTYADNMAALTHYISRVRTEMVNVTLLSYEMTAKTAQLVDVPNGFTAIVGEKRLISLYASQHARR